MIGCISGGTAGTSGMIAGSCSGIDAVFDRPPEIGVRLHDPVGKTGDGRFGRRLPYNTPCSTVRSG
jgi:hypothetical protein